MGANRSVNIKVAVKNHWAP